MSEPCPHGHKLRRKCNICDWEDDRSQIERLQRRIGSFVLIEAEFSHLCSENEQLKQRVADLERDATELRRMLAFAYSGHHLYGDDVELQDNRLPSIDFVRDSVTEIRKKMYERGMAQLAIDAAIVGASHAEKPEPLTDADLSVSEPYRTNRLLAHRERWIEYERERAERAIEALKEAKAYCDKNRFIIEALTSNPPQNAVAYRLIIKLDKALAEFSESTEEKT